MSAHPCRIAVLLVIAALVGCQWARPPKASDRFELEWEIREPTRAVSEATLFLTDEGFWGYAPEDQAEFDTQFAPGELLLMATETTDHFFVVAQAEQWGYRLQRLDDRPLAAEVTGDLRVVTDRDIEDRADLCTVTDDVAADCGVEERHRRWSLYDVDRPAIDESGDSLPDSRAIRLTGDFDDLYHNTSFPVVRAGLAGADRLSNWTEVHGGPTEGRPLLAIRSHPRRETTIEARLVVDQSCADDFEDSPLVSSHTADFDNYGIDGPIGSHPLAVEEAALRLEADAIVQCEGESPKLHVPALSRDLLPNPGAGMPRRLGVPSLGLKPRTLDGAADAQLARAAALVAAGDHTAAAFWLERFVADETDSVEEMGLVAMPILVAAGRPEQAIRTGHQITRTAWNPENVPDYLDGLIALTAFFEELDDHRDLVQHRNALQGRQLDDHRIGWYQWAEIRTQLAGSQTDYGPGFQEMIAEMERRGMEGWALAVWATIQLHDLELPVVDEPAELDGRFAEFGAGTYWTALRGIAEPIDCADRENPECHNVRLRPWEYTGGGDAESVIDRLRTTPAGELRSATPGDAPLAPPPPIDAARERTAWWLALAPLVDTSSLESVTELLLDDLRAQLDRSIAETCEDAEVWKARFDNAASRAAGTSTSVAHREWSSFVVWWRDVGLAGACGTPAQFLEAVRALEPGSNRWAQSLLPMLEDRILQRSAGSVDDELVRETTELARRLGDDRTCARWSLGTAIGAARSGHFETAETNLLEASRCLSDTSRLGDARDIVAEYVAFERGGGHRVVDHGAVERAVDRATLRRLDDSDACAGLLPLGFRLDSQLPASVMRIAERVQFESGPHGNFALRTATAFLDEGRAAYLSGLRDLQRGRVITAARSLEHARDQFGRVRHLPGLARIRFLDETVFAGRLTEIASEEVELEDATGELQRIRNGEARAVAQQFPTAAAGDTNSLPPLVVAAMLIDRRTEQLRQLDAPPPPRSPALCETEDLPEAPEVVEHREDGEPQP